MKITERDIIERIRRACPEAVGKLVTGIGDDCAVIDLGNGVLELLSTDTLVERVHFETSWHPPELLGRKAAAVNLSDVAAMGGVPKYALLSLALPAEISDEWLDKLISGFLAMLSSYKVELVGGDTVRSPGPLMLSVTIIGHADAKRVLKRSGAKIGDSIMVSGYLGEAAAGLELCRAGLLAAAADPWPELVKAHLDPEPEIALGMFLAESGRVNSMMDMSDGLATDIAHICEESGCGAEIDARLLPISGAVKEAAAELGMQPEKLAMSGGEDYLLLFTVAEEDVAGLIESVKRSTGRDIYEVGRIIDGEGVWLLEGQKHREIGYQGYDHFS